MRVLVVTSTFPRWHADTEPTFVFDLCQFLHKKGIQVEVLAPHAQGEKKQETPEGLTVYRYQYFISFLQKLTYSGGIMANLKKNPLNYILIPFLLFFQTIAVYRRLKSDKYQLIHAHWVIPQGFICAIANGLPGVQATPLICTSHGGDLYTLDNFIFRKIKKWTINRCDQFCVVSNAMKKKLTLMGILKEKINIMPMGVDMDNQFRPVSGLRRDDNRLIFVGRLVEKKGVAYLLEAMVEVIKAIPNINLLIAGDGPLRASLEMKSRKLNLDKNVRFYGSVQHHELPYLYSSASIALVPSIIASSGDQEGLGLVTIEAMSCGCAVIASSLEAIKDVIDTKSGILVTPGNALALSKKICFLINNPVQRGQMAAKGREKVLLRFNQKVIGEKYFQLIHKHKNS